MLLTVGMEVNIDFVVVYIVKLQDAMGSGVNNQIVLSVLDKVSDPIFRPGPVSTIKTLPLRGNIDKEKGGILQITFSAKHLKRKELLKT